MLEQPAGAGGKKVLAKVKGKIFLTNDLLSDKSLGALAEKFADKEPTFALERASDNTWSATLVAFMRRRPARGPITLWFYDKEDRSKPVQTKSVDRRKATMHFVYDMLLDGELGFKMCRTYEMQVGQIIRGKNKVYASGEVLTDPKSRKCKKKSKSKSKKKKVTSK
jgi:hypothetical protein